MPRKALACGDLLDGRDGVAVAHAVCFDLYLHEVIEVLHKRVSRWPERFGLIKFCTQCMAVHKATHTCTRTHATTHTHTQWVSGIVGVRGGQDRR